MFLLFSSSVIQCQLAVLNFLIFKVISMQSIFRHYAFVFYDLVDNPFHRVQNGLAEFLGRNIVLLCDSLLNRFSMSASSIFPGMLIKYIGLSFTFVAVPQSLLLVLRQAYLFTIPGSAPLLDVYYSLDE